MRFKQKSDEKGKELLVENVVWFNTKFSDLNSLEMNGKQSGQCKMMFILLKYQCIVCKIDSKTNHKLWAFFH